MSGAGRDIKAILFDLDDTLYEEKQFVMSGFKVVSQYLSRKYALDQDKIFKILKDSFRNGLRRKNFNVLLKELNLESENVETLVKMYREHLSTIALYPDARIVLEHLRNLNLFKLGLITDGYPITQKNKINSLRIQRHFDSIIINDLGKNISKLRLEPFKKMLFLLKVKPVNAIYVGDNPLKDFINPKKLGIYTVRVKRAGGEYSKINVKKNLDADSTITSLLELFKILNIKSYL
jgi:putative hydrolase of the HAD superfamily